MGNAGWLFLAILTAYSCALVAPLLQLQCRHRTLAGKFVTGSLVPIILACPLLIPSANVGLRTLSVLASVDIVFKMVDSIRHQRRVGRSISLREYSRFLIPFPVFSAVYPDHKRRLRRPARPWPQFLRIVGGILGVLLALLAVRTLSRIALVRSSFVINHALMLPTFVLAIESLSRASCGVERLAGFDTTPIIRNAYLSRTVAEFWRRYNDRIHEWFFRNVFLPTGGRRAPARSVLLVFLVSGLLHEVAFALATSRLTGYQFVFFVIQGPAALASGHLERLARRGGISGKIAAHGATIAFIAATSVLFFDGVRRIFPFIYASRSLLP
jgi:hypothetical protein